MVGVKRCERPYLLPLVCIFHMGFVCVYISVYQFVCALLLFSQIFQSHLLFPRPAGSGKPTSAP